MFVDKNRNFPDPLLKIVPFFILRLLFLFTSPKAVRFISGPFFWLLDPRRKKQKSELQGLKSILVISLDNIGDFVIDSAFLRELRRNSPFSRITLIVNSRVYNLAGSCPYVDKILTFDLREDFNYRTLLSRFKELRKRVRTLTFAAGHLWRKRFDMAIVPRWDTDTYHASLLAYFSGAKIRVAYSEHSRPQKHILNRNYDCLFTNLILDKSLRHEVEYNLEIIRFLGGEVQKDNLELWIEKDDLKFAESVLSKNKIDVPSVLIGIGPGALAAKRRWPIERFLELIQWFLLKETDSKIVLFGNSHDILLGRYIEECLSMDSRTRVINTIDRTTLRQAAAILKDCRFYIGNDSGLNHIASAMGVSVIEISSWPNSGDRFKSSSPFRFAPWGVRHIILNPETPLSPCREECISSKPHCILQVRVEEVKEAARELLSSLKR